MIVRTVALTALTLLPFAAASAPLHHDEIQAYAVIMAIAQTASDRCPDILVNQDMLGRAPSYFHMTPDDRRYYLLVMQIEKQRLAVAIDRAFSVKAWCDEAYRAYGPEGDTVKGLLRR